MCCVLKVSIKMEVGPPHTVVQELFANYSGLLKYENTLVVSETEKRLCKESGESKGDERK